MSTTKNTSSENFPTRLKNLISEAGIKKSELAKNLGIGPSAITQMIKGDSGASKRTIKALADFFSVSEEWLEHGTGEKRKPSSARQEHSVLYDQLSPEEQEFLRRFRSLDERHRQNILEMIAGYEALSEGGAEKTKVA